MPNIYSKDSFDRFGDDLCTELLQKISFKDKFRYECLSKQWKRFVYEEQHKLYINEEISNNLKAIELILQKCPNIRAIGMCFDRLRHERQLIELIVKYCRNITKIQWDFHSLNGFSDESIEKFFQKFGPNLKSIHITAHSNINNALKRGLKLCTKLKQLNAFNVKFSNLISNENMDSMNKLSELSFRYCKEDSNGFEIFVTKHRINVKSIEVIVDNYDSTIDEKTVKRLLNGLKQMPELIELKLHVLKISFNKQFFEQLKQIGLKCLKLKSFGLFFNSVEDNVLPEVLQTINTSFKQIKRLELNMFISPKLEFELLSQSLSECKQLTHFTIGSGNLFIREDSLIRDTFFDSIDKCWPKLQYLDINDTNISELALDSLAKLPDLQSISLSNNKKRELKDSSIYKMIIKLKRIKSVFINYRTYLRNGILCKVDVRKQLALMEGKARPNQNEPNT